MAGAKWPAAHDAILPAINESVFDTMSIGLTAFPVGTTPGARVPRRHLPQRVLQLPRLRAPGEHRPRSRSRSPIEPASHGEDRHHEWLNAQRARDRRSVGLVPRLRRHERWLQGAPGDEHRQPHDGPDHRRRLRLHLGVERSDADQRRVQRRPLQRLGVPHASQRCSSRRRGPTPRRRSRRSSSASPARTATGRIGDGARRPTACSSRSAPTR